MHVCEHPGPIAPGETATLDLVFKPGARPTTKRIRNCVVLDDDVASCAVATLQPLPPPPPALVLAKNAVVEKCSDTGGGCDFVVSITNTGDTEFVGPIEFADEVTTVDGKLFKGAEFDAVGPVGLTPDVLLPVFCQKQGFGFLLCTTGTAAARIPPNKTITFKMSVTPGAGHEDATAVKNCATLKGSAEPVCRNIPLVDGPLIRGHKAGGGNTCVPECAFAIAVKNIGNADATGPFTLDDVFTPVTSLGKIAKIDGEFNCGRVQDRLVCTATKDVLKPGETAIGRVLVTTKQEAPEYKNCVEVRERPGQFEVDKNAEGRCVTIVEAPKPDLKITKVSTSNGVCELKGSCPFRIVVRNDGKGPFEDFISIRDGLSDDQPIPVGVESFTPDWDCQKENPRKIVCKLKNKGLAPGASATLDVLITPGPLWQKDNIVRNCAAVLDVGDPIFACAEAKLDPFALEIKKSGGQSCVPGGECRFELDIFNPGPILHDDPVTVVDNLTGLSGAEIVSITQVSGNDPFPCQPAPTQIPFSCTGHMKLEIGERNIYAMVVKLPPDAPASGSFRNCAALADAPAQAAPGPAATGGTPQAEQSCHEVNLAPACTGGMELTPAGKCACPPGTSWDGAACAAPKGTSGGGINKAAPSEEEEKPTPVPQTKPPVLVPPPPKQTSPPKVEVCPPNKPVGKFPNCCPRGMTFSRGACRCPAGTELRGGVCRAPEKQAPKVCPPDRPVGSYPNCCPQGTTFQRGACREPQKAVPDTCPPNRPVGTPPNCCPQGTTFQRGSCRPPVQTLPPKRDCGPGYRVLEKPNKYGSYCEEIAPKKCPSNRPNGTPPNCCPTGTRFTQGHCYPEKCSPGWTGTPPNCQPPKQAPPPPPPPPPKPKCPPSMVGTPPNCTCRSGELFDGQKCIKDVS